MKRAAWFGLLLATSLTATAQTGATHELDSIEQRVLPCSACHGAEGRATREGYYPRIAGKPAGYLYNQLQNFRDNRRANAQMTYLVQRQSDAYLMEIAQHFAQIDLPYPPPEAPRAAALVLERGMKLARSGDAERGLPACQSCHGERLTGVAPAVPGLLGLPYDYIAAQLGSWREHIRRAQAPDCMAQIAERLSADDVAAVAAWLAAQPMPADTHPANTFTTPPPLQCGGLMPTAEHAP
ncbi:c-type cytochrome [Hydrocarboniphaga sp.]|uniref:c-type cytochrome n=1 Tax=Hydrocarboniphaga sp. TaxID=2033016 RepID=UPI003D0AC916